jgi:hypothetical protein
MSAEEEPTQSLGAEPPRPVHTYTLMAPNQLSIFKRSDLREIAQVGAVLLIDGAISAKEIGEKFCAAFDQELVTRGSGQ